MDSLINKIGLQILNPFVEFLVALAVVYFFWGVAKFLMNADSEQARTDVKKHIAWGTIGIFFMAGAWGIIKILQATLSSI